MLLNITWQIFLDMAVLVDAQGELLDNIETQVSQILIICLDYLTALLLLVQGLFCLLMPFCSRISSLHVAFLACL